MAFVRDRIFTLANLQRHSVVLDLNARSGLLTWEAIRQVPEGGVYACVYDPKDAAALTEQSRALPELNRPVILSSSLAELSITLTKHAASIQFDCVLGRNTLPRNSDPLTAIDQLAELIRKQGSKSNHRSNYRSNQFNKNHQSNENQIQPQLVLAETIPRRAQRLYQLLNPTWLDIDLYNRLADAEEAIYNQGLAASLTLDVDDLEAMFHQVGFAVTIQIEPLKTELLMTQNLIDRWFGNRSTLGYQSTNIAPSQAFPSYAEHLREWFTEKEVSEIQNCFVRYLCDQRVRWNSAIALISGTLISS
jgi:putative ATPase